MAKRRRAEESPDDESFFSRDGAVYNAARDGDLKNYLETHDGCSAFPLLRGYEPYQMMKEKGWLQPRISIIRLMWNMGRSDEHFVVTEDHQLAGIHDAPDHAGRPGVHDPQKVLTEGPNWEVHHLWLYDEPTHSL